MLGVALAVSLISGSLIAVDSATIGLLRERLEGYPVDFYGQGYSGYYADLDIDRYERVTSNLLAVDGVVQASYMLGSYEGFKLYNEDGELYSAIDSDWGWSPWNHVVMLPEDPSVVMDGLGIEGESPDPGTVAVPDKIATALGLEPGDHIVCSYETYEYEYVNYTSYYSVKYINISLEVSQVWGQVEGLQQPSDWWYWHETGAGDVNLLGYLNPVVMSVEDSELISGAFDDATPFFGMSDRYLVWIDRDQFINLANIALSVERLETLNGRLERAARESDVMFSSPLVNELIEMGADMNIRKITFIALSLPVVVMGAYLSIVGVDMGMTDRRRELGVLKSRGASNRQVFASLMMESLLLGSVASLVGLGLGFLLSRFLVEAVSGMFFTETADVGIAVFFVSTSTVIVALVFGVLLMVLSSYRPMKRAARMPVHEALHHYTPKAVRVSYKARYDIAALGLSIWSVASVLWLHDWIPEWRAGSYIAWIAILLLVLIGWALVPAVPFLLSVSIIRLVTRGSRRLYTRFSWLVRPWTKDLHYIVEKNIARNPKRASNIGIIVSLAVAFGLFVSITMESELAYAERVVLYEVGSDIKYSGYPAWTENGTTSVDYAVLESVGTVEGVDEAALCLSVNARVDYSYSSLVMFDSEKLTAVVDMDSGMFEGDGSHDIRDLKDNGTAFVTSWWAETHSVVVGDALSTELSIPSNGSEYTEETTLFYLEVIGFVSQLPALSGDVFVDVDTLSFIDPWWFEEEIAYVTVFATVEGGADHRETADRLFAHCADANLMGWVEVAEERLEEASMTPGFRSIRDFLYLEYALSLVMLTCGVGLVLFVTVWDRRQELACIMARGSSAEQMRRILMGESISLMAMGMIVGASTGALSAFLYSRLVYEVSYSGVGHETVFSWVSWAVLLAAVVSFLAASYLATYKVGRLKLAEILRIRGG